MLLEGEALAALGELRADVVVVGSGPGGICLAVELGRAGVDVLLLESGLSRFSERAQRLGDTDHLDLAVHAPMSECTRRQLGGASVIWGGRCVPYDPVDFDERPFVANARWPISYDTVAAFHQRASDYFFTGEAAFDLASVPSVVPRTLVPGLPDGDVLTSTLERWSLPTDFGREYRAELARSKRVRVALGVTCTHVRAARDGARVVGLDARTLGGRALTVVGRHYVLACGGVETTRLLLHSDDVHPGGLGNHAGHLGRHYMGHISGRVARVRFTTPPRATVFGFDRDPEGVYLRRRLSLSRDFQHRAALTNQVAWLANPTIGDPAHGNGVLSFAYLALTAPVLGARFAPDAIRRSAVSGAPDGAFWRHVANMLRDLPRTLAFIPTFGYRRFLAHRRVPGFFQYSASNVYDLHYQLDGADGRVRGARDRERR